MVTYVECDTCEQKQTENATVHSQADDKIKIYNKCFCCTFDDANFSSDWSTHQGGPGVHKELLILHYGHFSEMTSYQRLHWLPFSRNYVHRLNVFPRSTRLTVPTLLV